MASDKSPSRKETAHPYQWKPGQVFERPAILYSDGSFGAERDGDTIAELRSLLPGENDGVSDPANMTRVGHLRIEVLAVEDVDAMPVLTSTDVVNLLQCVRTLPRLTPSLKAEIDLVLSAVAHG